MNQKFKIMFAHIAVYQPIPHIAYCQDCPLSWWFYKKSFNDKDSHMYEQTWLGEKWSNFWWFLAK